MSLCWVRHARTQHSTSFFLFFGPLPSSTLSALLCLSGVGTCRKTLGKPPNPNLLLIAAAPPAHADPAIRDWVLIPIGIIMFLMGMLRNNVTKMLRKDVPPDMKQVAQNNQLMRARRLRANASYIPHHAFAARKHYFCHGETGILKQKMDKPDPMAQMQDPSMMMNMMQGNMANMVPQMAMMGIVNYFFAGFVLGKIPFPLTPSFKGMLQRGVMVTTLDTAYVTSMSWYFLVMFGMRGLHTLVLGAGATTDDTAMMQAQMGMMQQGQPGQPPDMGKLFAAEAENLQIVDHTWFLDAAEERLLNPNSKAANRAANAAAGEGGANKTAARKKRD